ncbi:hypothetical protein LR48_Vigan02g245800 [Vigna angularis]|uniref:Uncharacterized protein n=1 Tax=Phaseolus angularis TaxID=3914 RepID=A0A0L9U0F3_PHAAN|nr:hypothetical protein LR48_Vigan02g245800 [Vigna angularis]
MKGKKKNEEITEAVECIGFGSTSNRVSKAFRPRFEEDRSRRGQQKGLERSVSENELYFDFL